MLRQFKAGDKCVYRKQKHSVNPGPRAEAILPAPAGEDYSYFVCKYWIVDEVRHDNTIVLKTRRGKRRTVPANDPRLRHVHWWELLFRRGRFEFEDEPQGSAATA